MMPHEGEVAGYWNNQGFSSLFKLLGKHKANGMLWIYIIYPGGSSISVSSYINQLIYSLKYGYDVIFWKRTEFPAQESSKKAQH